MNLSPEEQEVMDRAREYEEMRKSPGWKQLSRFLDTRAAKAWGDLRDSQSSDDRINGNLQRRWQEREHAIIAINRQMDDAIAERNSKVRDILKAQGATEEQIERIAEKEEVMYG